MGLFCVESFSREATGHVLGPFLGQIIPFFQRYSHIPLFYGLLLTSTTLRYHPHIPSYLWVTSDFWQDIVWPLGMPFLDQIAQNSLFWGQTLCFLAEDPIFGDITHKRISPSCPYTKKTTFCVYPEIAWGMGTAF